MEKRKGIRVIRTAAIGCLMGALVFTGSLNSRVVALPSQEKEQGTGLRDSLQSIFDMMLEREAEGSAAEDPDPAMPDSEETAGKEDASEEPQVGENPAGETSDAAETKPSGWTSALVSGRENTPEPDPEDLQAPVQENVTLVPIYEVTPADEYALLNFLAWFCWLGNEYDYTTAAESVNWRGILEGIIMHPPCVNDSIYPGEKAEEVWGEQDPQGKWMSYRSYSVEKADWILKYIFNCSEDDIRKLKDNLFSGTDTYVQDGKYYSFMGGVGGGYDAKILETDYDGTYYTFRYSIQDAYFSEEEELTAIMQLKMIDGIKYWSLYKLGK